MFWGKQKQLEAKIAEYRLEVASAVAEMVKTFERCVGNYDPSFLAECRHAVHQHEGKADDIRREIEVMMYTKALFPESRGDVLLLIEATDKVANQAEKAVIRMKTQKMVIPPLFQPRLLSLAKICRNCSYALLDAEEKLFSNYRIAAEAIGKVDQLESEADHMEAGIIEDVFRSDLDGFNKLMMRDLVQDVAQVSDRALNAADRLRIIIAKRSI